MKLTTKNTLFRQISTSLVRTALATTLVLPLALTGCGLFSGDDASADNGTIGSLSAVVSSTHSAVVSNLIANSDESYVDLTLNLTGTTFSFSATGAASPTATTADDLAGSIVVTAGTATADRVYPLANIVAGATSATVRAYVAANAVESGSVAVTVKSGALSSRRALAATAGSYSAGGITVAETGSALSVNATTGTSWEATSKSYMLTLSQSGYQFASSLEGLVEVLDYSGENFDATTVTVSRTSDTVATVTVAGTVDVTNEAYATGTLAFLVADTAVVSSSDTSSTIGEEIICVSDESYVINGGQAAIAIGSSSARTASYSVRGMINATIESDTITLTLTNAYFADDATEDCITLVDSTVDEDDEDSGIEDLSITDFALGSAGSDGKIRTATFKVTAIEQLSSSDEDFDATVSFTVAAYGEANASELELTSAGSLDLSFVYYPGTHLEAPTVAQLIAANSADGTGAVTATCEVTQIVFDDQLEYSLATAVSAGETIATGTVGSTEVTFVAVSATAAGASSIAVKADTTELSGAVSLTISSDLVENADADVTFTQTTAINIATLTFDQDYASVTDALTVAASTNCESGLSIESGALKFDLPASTNSRSAYTTDDFGISSMTEGMYVVEFDATLATGTNQDSEIALRSTKATTNGSDGCNASSSSNYLFRLTGLATTKKWTLNDDDGTQVLLDTSTAYHFTIQVDIDNQTVYAWITDPDGGYMAGSASSGVAVNQAGDSWLADNINMMCGRYATSTQIIDNVVVYKNR